MTGLSKFTWHKELWTCSSCGWEGTGNAAETEIFSELFKLNCRECGSRLALISYPTIEEIEQAAALGVPEAVEMLPTAQTVKQGRLHLAEARQGLLALPNVEGEMLTFSLEDEAERDWLSPEWLILLCEGSEIYREPSGFEGWRAILEIGEAVRKKYGARAIWLDPGDAGVDLLGDDISASRHIETYLKDSGLTPPVGRWASPA